MVCVCVVVCVSDIAAYLPANAMCRGCCHTNASARARAKDSTVPRTCVCCNTLQHTATHCNTLHHTATHHKRKTNVSDSYQNKAKKN